MRCNKEIKQYVNILKKTRVTELDDYVGPA